MKSGYWWKLLFLVVLMSAFTLGVTFAGNINANENLPELLFNGEWEEGVDELAYSPDGETIAIGADVFKLFSVPDLEVIYSDEGVPYGDQLETKGIDYSPDGSMLALVGGSNDGIFDAEDLTEIQPLTGNQTDVAFSPSGERLATARWDQGTIRIWEAENGKDIEEVWDYEHEEWVNDIAFSPCSQYLAAGFYDGKVLLFDVENREMTDTIDFEESGATDPLTFSPDGTLAVKAPDIVEKIYFFSLDNGNLEMERDLTTHTGIVEAMDYSPDGDYFAFGGSGDENFAVIYDTGDWSQPLYWLEHEVRVRDLSFSPDSAKLAVAARMGTNGDFYLYQLEYAERLAGLNRYETAVEISQAAFPEDGNVDNVVLARGDDFPDALAGVPLAYNLDAPILLTRTGYLYEDTAEEIERLGAEKAYLLGGTNALSNNVKEELEDMDLETERFGGANRYDTARIIAEEVAPQGSDTAVIASGLEFQDALIASPYAAVEGYPILLSRQGELHEDTEKALDALGAQKSLVVGNPTEIGDEVLTELPGETPERINNTAHYSNAVEAAQYFDTPAEEMYVATGEVFADAISGGVLAARENSGILLVGDTVPGEISSYLIEKNITNVKIFGGEAAVDNNVAKGLSEILD